MERGALAQLLPPARGLQGGGLEPEAWALLGSAGENSALGPWSYYRWEEAGPELGPGELRGLEMELAQLVECSPSVHRALGSIPIPT